MKKFLNFCSKNKMFLGLGIISILLFLTQLWQPIEWVSAVMIFAFAIICSVSEVFCLNMFLMAFSGVGFQFIVGIVSGLVSLLIKYIIDLKNKKKKVFKLPLILSAIILIVYSVFNYGVDYEGVTFGLMIIYIIALVYFVFVFKKEIDISKCFTYLLCGLVVSVALSVVSLPFDSFNKELYHFDGTYKRFHLLTFHMNNLSIHSMFLIAYSIYSIFNKKRKLWIDIVSIVVALALGIATMSKAFLLITALCLVYLVVCLIEKFKKRSIKYILCLAGVVIVALIVGWRFIDNILNRFFLYFKEGSILNMLTTGRADIWKGYLKEWTSSPAKIFFGVGMFTKQPMFSSAHNVWIFLLHRFGLVGICLIAFLVYAYIKESDSKFKISLYNVLVFGLWFIVSIEENVLSDQFAIYLMFGIILMLKNKNNEETNQTIDETSVCLVDNNKKIEDNKNIENAKILDEK